MRLLAVEEIGDEVHQTLSNAFAATGLSLRVVVDDFGLVLIHNREQNCAESVRFGPGQADLY